MKNIIKKKKKATNNFEVKEYNISNKNMSKEKNM